MSSNQSVDSVMQAYEDAMVTEVLRVFGDDTRVYSQEKTGEIPPECIIFANKVTNMARVSDDVQSRTIMTDIAVVTQQSSYWAQDMLMKMTSFQIGNVKKVIPSGRFSKVEGVVHLTFYVKVTEINE